jgi:hypothetical protein
MVGHGIPRCAPQARCVQVHRDGRLEANVGFVLKVAWVEGPAFTSCQRSVSAAVTR